MNCETVPHMTGNYSLQCRSVKGSLSTPLLLCAAPPFWSTFDRHFFRVQTMCCWLRLDRNSIWASVGGNKLDERDGGWRMPRNWNENGRIVRVKEIFSRGGSVLHWAAVKLSWFIHTQHHSISVYMYEISFHSFLRSSPVRHFRQHDGV